MEIAESRLKTNWRRKEKEPHKVKQVLGSGASKRGFDSGKCV